MLTDKEIGALKPKKSSYQVWEKTRQRGTGRLGVKVQASGSKTFIYRYFVDAGTKAKFVTIGRYPEIKLKRAREIAAEYAAKIAEGEDPKAQAAKLSAERAGLGTVADLIDFYTGKMERDGKSTWKAVKAKMEGAIQDATRIRPEMLACDVTTDQVKDLLADMIDRGAVVGSNRIRSYFLAAFNAAIKAEHNPADRAYAGRFKLTHNPIALIPKQESAEKPRERHLKRQELSRLLGYLRSSRSSGAAIIRLCVYLGGQRPFEVINSTWADINWEERLLVVPGNISKNRRAHIVPINDQAFAMLKRLHEDRRNKWIFCNLGATEPYRSDSLAQFVTRTAQKTKIAHFQPRDIRRTVKTLMGEMGVSKELRDRIQNHAMHDVSAKHYDRYDYLVEKRDALEQWSSYLVKLEKL